MKILRVFALLLLPVSLNFSVSAQDQFTRALKDSPAPDFTFESKPGVTTKLSDYRGKVVLITFFATWCGPCRAELPHIQKDIYEKYAGNPKFELLIFGREHGWEAINKFRAEQKFTMPFYPDPERKIFSLYASQNIPRNFLVDPAGKVVYSAVGFNEADFSRLKSEIETFLLN